MFIKIIIIVAILGLGLAVFSFEDNNIFTNASGNVIESMRDGMNSIGVKTSKSVENSYDSSVKMVDASSNKINSQINNAKESSQDLLTEKISKINIVNDVEKIFKKDTEKKSPETTTLPSNNDNPNNSSYSDSAADVNSNSKIIYSQSIINEKLSLSSVQQVNGDVLLQYFDDTGNTKSAKVIIRTSEKEIFSGTFYTSNFKTVINDVSGTPYYMDVIVEHKIYGTVTSSIFNSGGSTDYKIIGMFAQS